MRRSLRIGSVVFEVESGEVTRAGVAVRLEPQPAAVLALLASRPGELVSHEDLRRAIWGEATHVNFQQSLHYCVRQIRMALGDTVRSAPMIESIPRRGYRLRAPVESLTSGGAPPPPLAGDWRGGPRWALWAAVAVSLLLAGAAIERRPNNHHQIATAVLQGVHDLVY
jgi:DNA-binding winged helix-turn-helix (wHTH) protein